MSQSKDRWQLSFLPHFELPAWRLNQHFVPGRGASWEGPSSDKHHGSFGSKPLKSALISLMAFNERQSQVAPVVCADFPTFHHLQVRYRLCSSIYLFTVWFAHSLNKKQEECMHFMQGISLHLTDMFLEEVNRFAVPQAASPILLEPFLRVLLHSSDKLLLPRVETEVFGALIDERQRSADDGELYRL